MHTFTHFLGHPVGDKGGLVTESFSLWLKSPKKVIKKGVQDSDLAPLLGDLSQSEKHSEIILKKNESKDTFIKVGHYRSICTNIISS